MNKTTIYTAIFGNYDNLIEPKYIPKEADLICFTDSDLKSDMWQIHKVEKTEVDATRNARKYKILPHKFLPEYDVSIWIDGNVLVRGDVNELVEKYLDKVNMAVYNHSSLKPIPLGISGKIKKYILGPKTTQPESNQGRDCIYEEAEILIKMTDSGKFKDHPEIIKKQVEKYRAEGYPEHNGLLSSMIMLRRHNESEVIQTMEDWWKELKLHSRRDQLSFNYVAWKNQLDFKYIKEDSRDNHYFLWRPHPNK
jgi:hypothetical protein